MKGAGPPRPASAPAALPTGAEAARLAHDLRASLNGLRTWSQVLEERLAGHSDPLVARALEGIRTSIDQQVRLIEERMEG